MLSVSRVLFAASCLFAPLAAIAQEHPAAIEPATVTDCESFLKSWGFFIELTKGGKIEPIDGGCHGTHLYFVLNPSMRWLFEDMRVTGTDLFLSATENRLPDALEATATGMRFSQTVSSPNLSYQLRALQRTNDIHLSYRWDRHSRDLLLHDFSWVNRQFGSFSLSGAMSNLSELPPLKGKRAQGSDQATIKNVSARLESHGLFEILVVQALISKLPWDEEPQPLVERYQLSAKASIDALPEAVASADSKAALKTFVASFPHPAGLYELNAETQPQVSIAELAKAKDPAALMELFNRIRISVTHKPPQE